MVKFIDENYLSLCLQLLYSKLQKCSIKRELIDTTLVRGIGKTTALINFAKENDLIVFVASNQMALHFRNEFNYEKIVSPNMFIRGLFEYGGHCVVDEGVNIKAVEDLGFTIVTGYFSE